MRSPVVLLAIAASTMAHSTLAQAPQRPEATGVSRGAVPLNTVRVRPGYSAILTLDRPIKTITIGDPDLVEATAETDRAIVIRARRDAGTTNLLVIGEGGDLIYSATIIVNTSSVRVYLGSPGANKNLEPRSFSCTETDCVRTDKAPPAPTPIIMLPQMQLGAQ